MAAQANSFLADVTASYLGPGTPGYWASYNRPAYPLFPSLFNVSGQWALINEYGDHFSWSKTARAQARMLHDRGTHDK